MQRFAGHLIYELSTKELEEALARLVGLSNQAIESGQEDLNEVYCCLSLIGGVALSTEGKRIISERAGAIPKLLHLCDCTVNEVVRLALTALERMARELEYGKGINTQGGMVSERILLRSLS